MPPNPLARSFAFPTSNTSAPVPPSSITSSYPLDSRHLTSTYTSESPHTSSQSIGTSRSGSLSSLSSTSFPLSPPVQVKLPSPTKSYEFGAIGDETRRIRQFGEGWKSAAALGMERTQGEGNGLEVDVEPRTPDMSHYQLGLDVDTPLAPSRIRTPSMPILPNQGILRYNDGPVFIPDQAHNASYTSNHGHSPSVDSDPLVLSFNNLSFNPYTGQYSPYSPNILLADTNPFHTVPRQSPFPTPTKTPVLRNHQSVPDLESSQRRRGSVRFSDELRYEDESEDGRPRLGSRSLSNLASVGKKRNVYIHCLHGQITEHALKAFAEGYGKVLSMRVAVEEGKGSLEGYESRRYAFVMFDSMDQAGTFINAIRAKGIPCEYAKEDWQTEYRAREDPTSSNIYVVGLPLEWGKDEVEDYMTQFGRVASLRLLEDKDGNRRGPVLVRFDSRPQAERAIRMLNGHSLPGNGERLQARIADSDGQKDFKKLRTSTSADLLVDDRDAASHNDEGSVEYLHTIRDKYARRLALLNAQITAAEQGYPYNPDYSPQTISPGAFRHRHLSNTSYTPWQGTPPAHHTGLGGFGYPSPHGDGYLGGVSYGQNTPSRENTIYRSPSEIFQQGGSQVLHHAKSTPEFGLGRSESPAKLLWPN